MNARRRSNAARVALLVAALGCAEHAPPVTSGPLSSGVAARAGTENIPLSSVARIARAQGITPKAAREHAITDALFAAAVRQNPNDAPRVAAAERGVLARALLDGIRADALALGPPTDDELQKLTDQRWPELDRPPSARTTHAVVLVKKPADDAPARELARELARAVSGAKDSDDFIARARAVPKQGLEVTAERLPPVTPDGRLWSHEDRPPKPIDGSLDLDFTSAAVALERPGEQSAIVKSAFGYHVIRLDERYPELRTSLDERRSLLTPEIQSRRAKRELDALMTRLRAQTAVTTERAAEALTALVPVGP
jgi:peptidyl-prolyl cis-trans isomerase C